MSIDFNVQGRSWLACTTHRKSARPRVRMLRGYASGIGILGSSTFNPLTKQEKTILMVCWIGRADGSRTSEEFATS